MNIGFDYDGTLTNPAIKNLFDILHPWANIPNAEYELYIVSNNSRVHSLVSNVDQIGGVKLIYTQNKAKTINSEKIDLYFEDNLLEAKLIEEQCPNTKVILVDLSLINVTKSPSGIVTL